LTKAQRADNSTRLHRMAAPIGALQHRRHIDLGRWPRLLELMGLWPENQGVWLWIYWARMPRQAINNDPRMVNS